MDFPRRLSSRWHSNRRGQSIVEAALFMPALLVILSGMFEFGFLFTHYLAALDATRNAARFSSDSQYDIADATMDCSLTTDFYRQTACLVLTELAAEQPTISLCLQGYSFGEHCPPPGGYSLDDIIVSVFSITRSPGMSVLRFPLGVDQGWSYDVDLANGDQTDSRGGVHATRFDTARVESMLDPAAPNTGIVIVELNYNYWQVMSLPWFTAFVADPIPLHLYAVWPLVSAEPTSTPKP